MFQFDIGIRSRKPERHLCQSGAYVSVIANVSRIELPALLELSW